MPPGTAQGTRRQASAKGGSHLSPSQEVHTTKWLFEERQSCRTPLKAEDLLPNPKLKAEIEEWKREQRAAARMGKDS